MLTLRALFDIHTTFFTIASYDMSYLEFFGTVLTIWCVWLTAKAKILSWPIGILGSLLYLFLFYQIQLYSDLLEQVYFLVTGVVGWFMWLAYKKEINQEDQTVQVTWSAPKERAMYFMIAVIGTGILAGITIHLTDWFPTYFPEPVSYPWLDAGTTAMSFLAQWLLMRKRIESWFLWILVDAIDIGLYWVKGVKFISAEYLLFFFIAFFGMLNWIKIAKRAHSTRV